MKHTYNTHWWGYGAAWLALIGCGMWALADYANTPGQTSSLPTHWPTHSSIVRSPDQATLLMFAHPHCPCTQASVNELERLMARARGYAQAQVVFFLPAGEEPTWAHGRLWRAATRIPNVTARTDPGGAEAERFGVMTSGHVALYDLKGALLFTGGITSSRGHEGDNPGQQAILQILKQNMGPADHAVYGCALTSSNARSAPTP